MTMTKTISMTRWAFVFALLALVAITPDMASALAGLENGICTVVSALTGKIGRAIATVAIVFLGIGAFFGKVNWGLALVVSVGIVGIFGATFIAKQLADVSGGGATATAC
jgi:type IV secretory pathway VirB2 component (pilin)